MNHLLRTLAAVPPSARVVLLGDSPSEAEEALTQLGFDLGASGEHPDDPSTADWVAVWVDDVARLPSRFATSARILAPGAWVWISVRSDTLAPEALVDFADDAGLVLAERPLASGSPRRIRGIFRRVDAGTTA